VTVGLGFVKLCERIIRRLRQNDSMSLLHATCNGESFHWVMLQKMT
jgi:hypothetical protein